MESGVSIEDAENDDDMEAEYSSDANFDPKDVSKDGGIDSPFVGRTQAEDDMRFGEGGGNAVSGWGPSRLKAEIHRLQSRSRELARNARLTEDEAGAAIDRLQARKNYS